MNKAEEAGEWFAFANRDLDSAKHLMSMWPLPFEIICFHCQQAAEKFIKGVTVCAGGEIIKTHDLPKLCERIADKVDADAISVACDHLTIYATTSRYPFALELDEAQTKAAIAQAQKVKEWAEGIIGDF